MINLCKCRYFLIRNIWNDHLRFKNIMKYQCHYRSTDINSTLFQSLHKKCDIVRTSNQFKHVTFTLLLFFIIIQVNFASIQNCVCWNRNCSSWIFLMAFISQEPNDWRCESSNQLPLHQLCKYSTMNRCNRFLNVVGVKFNPQCMGYTSYVPWLNFHFNKILVFLVNQNVVRPITQMFFWIWRSLFHLVNSECYITETLNWKLWKVVKLRVIFLKFFK